MKKLHNIGNIKIYYPTRKKLIMKRNTLKVILVLLLATVAGVIGTSLKTQALTAQNGWDATHSHYYNNGKILSGGAFAIFVNGVPVGNNTQLYVSNTYVAPQLPTGANAKQWVSEGLNTYDFNSTGLIQKGLLQPASTYLQYPAYFNTSTGALSMMEKSASGHWYLLGQNNLYLVGFQNLSEIGQNKTCYYAPATGQMLYGQQNISGHWYLLATGSGAVLTGFQNLSAYGQNKTVYYNAQGQMLYGTQIINEKSYYFNTATGALQ
jgi:glucan-binding YG repeat protein